MLNKQTSFIKTCLGAVLVVVMFGLPACGGDKHSELKDYIKEIKHRKAGGIESLPEIKPHQKYEYPTEARRSPFKPVRKARYGNGVMPDEYRPKELLESFPLDSLRMVGTLKRGHKDWAIITAPDGTVHRVMLGAYIGQNFGKVVEIAGHDLKLVETISSGKGWEHRNASLALIEDNQEQK